MKKGVTESRQRRDHAKALEDAKSPVDPETPARLSLLARMLRSPNKPNAVALVKQASRGELTTHDMQAGLAALLVDAKEQAKDATAADKRAYIVLQKQLVEGLKDVVLAAPSSAGPSVVAELHWPAEFAGPDQGEAVRTKVPDGMVV